MENLEDLIHQVKESGADIGIGYDGDADRIGVIDDTGQVLWGDRLLLLFARDVLADHPGEPLSQRSKPHRCYMMISIVGEEGIMWKPAIP